MGPPLCTNAILGFFRTSIRCKGQHSFLARQIKQVAANGSPNSSYRCAPDLSLFCCPAPQMERYEAIRTKSVEALLEAEGTKGVRNTRILARRSFKWSPPPRCLHDVWAGSLSHSHPAHWGGGQTHRQKRLAQVICHKGARSPEFVWANGPIFGPTDPRSSPPKAVVPRALETLLSPGGSQISAWS